MIVENRDWRQEIAGLALSPAWRATRKRRCSALQLAG